MSRVTPDKRRAPDPHYRMYIKNNAVYFRRLKYNENTLRGGNRSLLRKVVRLYPAIPLSAADTSVICANLTPPVMAQMVDSGASQFLFEKLGSLAIGDC